MSLTQEQEAQLILLLQWHLKQASGSQVGVGTAWGVWGASSSCCCSGTSSRRVGPRSGWGQVTEWGVGEPQLILLLQRHLEQASGRGSKAWRPIRRTDPQAQSRPRLLLYRDWKCAAEEARYLLPPIAGGADCAAQEPGHAAAGGGGRWVGLVLVWQDLAPRVGHCTAPSRLQRGRRRVRRVCQQLNERTCTNRFWLKVALACYPPITSGLQSTLAYHPWLSPLVIAPPSAAVQRSAQPGAQQHGQWGAERSAFRRYRHLRRRARGGAAGGAAGELAVALTAACIHTKVHPCGWHSGHSGHRLLLLMQAAAPNDHLALTAGCPALLRRCRPRLSWTG